MSEDNQGHNQRPYLPLAALFITILVAFSVAVFWILGGIQEQMDKRLASSLQAILSTTDKALQNWAEQTQIDVAVFAESDDLRDKVESQLRVDRRTVDLLKSPALQDIRHLLAPVMKFHQFPGFAVIAPDGTQIAAHRNEAVGMRDIAENSPDLFAKVMAGNTSLGLPFRSRLFVDATTDREFPIMVIAAPIRDRHRNVIAVLALDADPRRDFTRAARLGRLETTGDTYAFDRNARLLTESRFEDELRRAGVIRSDASSVLNLEIRDPGVNLNNGATTSIPQSQQPLTRMAQSAVTGNSGIDLQGYRDYRGVPVVGAWLWDDQLNMGLATEMDVREAFAPFRRVRELILFTLFLITGVSVALMLILRHRRRLLASNEAFQHAVQARDDMMAMVSHDLKNPINAMVLRSHIMIHMLDSDAKKEDIKRNLELQQRTARHMTQLIGDLTDFARIQAGRLALERRECTVLQIIEPAIERARLLASERGIEFEAQVASNMPMICVAPSRVTQIMDNLLGNALKFTTEGGRISVEAFRIANEVQISVADTGPGIPKDALARIFEPYWQVQKTRSGMGLGLFIAKTLVETHGGKIWVQSVPGRGTTFYFTLPVKDTAANRQARTSDAQWSTPA
jgi:signal transduction histidine kinase